jgi:RNA polymerase sigma-70 factor (ECF subfamily)
MMHPIPIDSTEIPYADNDLQAPERDSILVEQCLQGDELAWETIVKSYGKRIYNLAFRFTGRKSEAEDLTQETFIRAYQTLQTFRLETGSFGNWLLRVARNLIIDHYRRERRLCGNTASEDVEDLKLEDERTPSPQRMAEQEEAARFLRGGMMTLSPNLKEAVLLRDMEGLAYHEIARLMGVSEGTIKSRVSRGRLQLAKILGRRRSGFGPAFGVAI